MLHFITFRKSYGPVQILHIDDLEVNAGIYWVQGANGSGKSTLLKSIAGILHFDGHIEVGGINSRQQPVAFRQSVNFAEAEPLFPEFLTGREMINLFVAAKHGSPGQQNAFIESMNMGSFVDHPVGTYSSGMLKKLSILLAFLGTPKLILLDEPFITMDAASLQVLNVWIKDTHRQQGTSFILTSHQSHEIEGLPLTNSLLVENQTLRFTT